MKRFLLALSIFAAFVGGYMLRDGRCRRSVPDTIVVRDTTTVTDTIVEYVPEWHEVTRTETDTMLVTVHDTDTVLVEIPIEYSHDTFENGEVWYHGYRAGIDSLEAYRQTVLVETTRTEREKAPRLGIGVSAGYGIGKSGFTPYVGVGLSWRIVSIGGRKGKREPRTDYE